MAKLHSFDVFDTSLIRRVAFPSDVFRLIGRRIAQESDLIAQREFIEDFVSARVLAERETLSDSEETTLERIWTVLRNSMPCLPPSCGPQYELNVERDVLRPNLLIARRIEELRAAGAKIAFTSDTYLPAEFVKLELLRYGLAKNEDSFYISSSLFLTKRSGSLFNKILSAEKIPAHSLCHYGDNQQSDYESPRRLGISAELLSVAKLNSIEQSLLNSESSVKEAASWLAGSMRAFRLKRSSNHNSGAHELVSTFIGPAVAIWASWILASAHRDGVKRLYFASRDGNLVWRAARILAPQFGNIDCRYLKISRQSILLPAIDEISPRGISWLQRSWELPELGRLLQKVGLEWQEVAHEFSELAGKSGNKKVLVSERDWSEFWTILRSPKVEGLLASKIRDARTMALNYLKMEGLDDDQSIGIVDLGWFLTVQGALQRLLTIAKFRARLKGYYLGLRIERAGQSVAGPSVALFYDSPPDERIAVKAYEIFDRANILEHVLGLATHGTVREYRSIDGNVEAVCAEVPEPHRDTVTYVERCVEEFCREVSSEVVMYCDEDVARSLIDKLITAWCRMPCDGTIEVLEQVKASVDQNNIDAEFLVKPWTAGEATKALLPGRLRQKLNLTIWAPMWPEAALRVSKGWPLKLIKLRRIVDVLMIVLRRKGMGWRDNAR